MIVRMARVGEQSGALGRMLEQSGEVEELAAVRQLDRLTKWLGPALIVILGAVIGSVMAALLAAVAGIGASVLD